MIRYGLDPLIRIHSGQHIKVQYFQVKVTFYLCECDIFGVIAFYDYIRKILLNDSKTFSLEIARLYMIIES